MNKVLLKLGWVIKEDISYLDMLGDIALGKIFFKEKSEKIEYYRKYCVICALPIEPDSPFKLCTDCVQKEVKQNRFFRKEKSSQYRLMKHTKHTKKTQIIAKKKEYIQIELS